MDLNHIWCNNSAPGIIILTKTNYVMTSSYHVRKHVLYFAPQQDSSSSSELPLELRERLGRNMLENYRLFWYSIQHCIRKCIRNKTNMDSRWNFKTSSKTCSEWTSTIKCWKNFCKKKGTRRAWNFEQKRQSRRQTQIAAWKKFGEIYDFQTRRDYDKIIKTADRQTVCHKYHSKDLCNEKCLFKDSHIILKDSDILKMADFKKFALSKSKNKADQNPQKG